MRRTSVLLGCLWLGAAPAHDPAQDVIPYAVVNIPAARLDVFVNSTLSRSYPVAVGSSKFRTPVGSFEITEIVWNPW